MSERTERRGRRGGLGPAGSTALLGLVLAGGCASAPPPAAETARKAETEAPATYRLAWMPLDAFNGPVAVAVNDQMSRLKPAGTSASVKAPVSMEVAQLAIECIQPTPACYGAVARSLNADRLLWAELASPADEKVEVTVVMFDVQAGKPARRTGTFADEQAARAGVADLVQRAADPGSRPQ